MENISSLKKLIASHYQPICAVMASENVTKMLAQTQLKPSELLKPFGDFTNEETQFKLQTSEKNTSINLRHFKIDFCDINDLNETLPTAETVNQLILQNGPHFNEHSLNASSETSSLLQSTPWYQRWKDYYLHVSRFQDHELIHQPVALFYFISTSETDLIQSSEQLIKQRLPKAYQDGIYDFDQPRVFFLFHNLNDNINAEAAGKLIYKLKNKYQTAYCQLISMKGIIGKECVEEDIWSNYIVDTDYSNSISFIDTIRGQIFTTTDRAILMNTVNEVVEKIILPNVSKKLRTKEYNVQLKKKGFKNMMKAFLKKPERSDTDGQKNNFIMNQSDIEIKNITDMSFMFQHYDMCINYMKSPLKEFKKINAFRHAGGCYELLLISNLVLDPQYSNSENFNIHFEKAYELFRKAGSTKLLLRNCIILSTLFIHIGKYSEAAHMLLRASRFVSESNVINPLLLEQVAHCFLRKQQLRQFAFFMIQSARSYEKLGYVHYSFNCYGIVEKFYTKVRWNNIKQQLYDKLSSHQYYLSNSTLSINLFRNILEMTCDLTDSNQQQKQLTSFLDVVSKWNDCKTNNTNNPFFEEENHQEQQLEIGFLKLPVIIEDSIEVFTNIERVFSNNQLIDERYLRIENVDLYQNAKNSLNTQRCPWKYLQRVLFEQDIPKIIKDVTMDERIEIDIMDARTKMSKGQTKLKKRTCFIGEPISVVMLIKNPLMAEINISKIQLVVDQECIINEKQIILNQNEVKEIILDIIPLKQGELIIKGIQWELFGVVKCCLMFNEIQRLTGKDKWFQYNIIDESGSLEVSTNIKQSYIYGEIDNLNINIKNTSKYVITDVHAVCSHPVMFGVTYFKITDQIQCGESIQKHLNFRAALTGNVETKFLIRYRVDNVNRLTRIVEKILIQDSFRLTVDGYYSTKDSKQYVLNLNHQNIQLQQVRIFGNKWNIEQKNYQQQTQNTCFILTEKQEDQTLKAIYYNEQPIDFDEHKWKILIENERNLMKKQPLDADHIDLVVHWEIDGIKNGFHTKFGVSVNKLQFNKDVFTQFPIQASFICNQLFKHDFTQRQENHISKCVISIIIRLRNLYRDEPISFIMKCENTDSFTWIGKTQHIINDIEPRVIQQQQKTIDITIRAQINQPGIYDLNQFQFKIFRDSQTAKIVHPNEALTECVLQTESNRRRFSSIGQAVDVSTQRRVRPSTFTLPNSNLWVTLINS